MTTDLLLPAFFLFFIIATLYSSVGHAGASGYLAVMAILSFTPESIKPASLVLNSIVAFIASIRYIGAGYFNSKVFFPFIITSVPCSFAGGYWSIRPDLFKLIAGVFLIVSAVFMLANAFFRTVEKEETAKMPPVYGLVLGAIIGLFSGLIGVGGGIFLSPILILYRWATVRTASGIAALFILLNSLSGLAGHLSAFRYLDSTIAYWILAVILGGMLGTYLGTTRFNHKIIIGCLFFVLMTAGLKFIVVDFLK